jgi:phage shock protein E
VERLKKVICGTLILIFLTMAGFSSAVFADDNSGHFIIDVRTLQEWNDGHIEGAALIPYYQIDKSIGRVAKDKSKRIYLYCRSGRRSAIAGETLSRMGYKDVVNLGSLEDAARFLKLKIVK